MLHFTKKNMRALICIIIVFICTALICGCEQKYIAEDETFLPASDSPYNMYVDDLCSVGVGEDETAYYVNGAFNCYLYRIDKETGVAAPLCNRVDCLHDNETDGTLVADCNAYMAQTDVGGEILVNEDRVFAVVGIPTVAETGHFVDDVWLVSYSKDGSGYRKLLQPDRGLSCWTLHRGYIYMAESSQIVDTGSDEQEQYFRICRVPIDKPNSKKEILFEEKDEGSTASTYNLWIMGSRCYFILRHTAEDGTVLSNQLCSISLLDNSVSFITAAEMSISSAGFCENGRYIFACAREVNDTKKPWYLYQVDENGALSPIYGPEDYRFSVTSDGEHIILDHQIAVIFGRQEGRRLTVLNTRGEVLNTIILDNGSLPFIGVANAALLYVGNEIEGAYGNPIMCLPLDDLFDSQSGLSLLYKYTPKIQFPGLIIKT